MAQIEVQHYKGHFTWGFLSKESDSALFRKLVHHMAGEATLKKLRHLTVTLNANSPEVDLFHEEGFINLSREKIYRYTPPENNNSSKNLSATWRHTHPRDHFTLDRLQIKILTALEKLYTLPPSLNPPNFVLEIDHDLVGYAYVLSSLHKAFITIFINHDLQTSEGMLDEFIQTFFGAKKMILLRQPGGQSWKENHLSGNTFEISPEKIVLVKPLAIRTHDPLMHFEHAGNNKTTDTILPISEVKASQDNL